MREVFDLFDFWDGRDGLVDAAKVGDLLRCIGLNPTNALIKRHGGTEKFGMSFVKKITTVLYGAHEFCFGISF